MKKILLLLKAGFESSSVKTPEFKAFASAFKKAITVELKTVGANILAYSVGHFDVSGFFEKDGQIFYFSLGDIRGMEFKHEIQMMYSTAKHIKDYTGGSNQWVRVEEGMAQNMSLR